MTLGDRLVVMHDGVVQQVDPPMTVYQRPINRFVASLIGSPPMNFFDARLEVDGSQAVCKGGFGEVPIQVDRESYLASFNGRNVVLGIRPEHLHVNDRASASGGSDAGRRLARIGVATVQQVEPLGDRRVLRLSLSNGKAVIAKGDADIPAEPGATVDLSFEAANLHVFAATEGGERLA